MTFHEITVGDIIYVIKEYAVTWLIERKDVDNHRIKIPKSTISSIEDIKAKIVNGKLYIDSDKYFVEN